MNRLTTNKTRRRLAAGIIALVTLSLVPLAAQAWGRGKHRGPSPERAIERLTDELGLTAEQQPQVKTILDESFAKREELRETHRQEMLALHDATHESLAALLSPEQMEKLDDLRGRRLDCREHRRDCDRRPGCWDEGPGTDE